jgi:hypothetical protein
MRIKLKGELTEDRLKEALALIGAQGPGVKCYFDGVLDVHPAASQDLERADADAVAGSVVLADEDDEADFAEEDEWYGPTPSYVSGVIDNSPEELERRRLAKVADEKYRRKREEEDALEKRLMREHITNKEIFGRLVERYGHDLIDAINTEISAVWGEVKPVFLHNMKGGVAGAPRPMPQLELRGTTVSFYGYNSAGNTMRIVSPLTVGGRRSVRPIWLYAEWVGIAVPRISAVIDRFAESANLVRVDVAGNPPGHTPQ